MRMPPRRTFRPLEIFLLAGGLLVAPGVAQISGSTNTPPTPASLSQPDGAHQRYLWNSNSLASAYTRHGRRDARWNDTAYAALEAYARVLGADPSAQAPFKLLISSKTQAAMAAGCDDPMIRYLYARNVELTNLTIPQQDKFYRHVAADMKASGYPAIRKFYAALRMANELDRVSSNTPPEVRVLWRDAQDALVEALHDRNMPPDEVSEACYLLMKTRDFQYDPFHAFEEVAFANWPRLPTLHFLKAEALIQHAWSARGGGYANTVKPEQWKLFGERLEVAAQSVDSSWRLFPSDGRFPWKMIIIEMGQGQGRPRMEMWFRRAMKADTNNYDACAAKLLYLEPKWHGSVEDMLEFGRQCVASTNWGGAIPTILVDAHFVIGNKYTEPEKRAAYWKRDEVWADIKPAYEKVFALAPEWDHLHVYYAGYAYRAEQWDELNRQIALFKNPNPDNVGGPEAFDKMLKDAKAHQKTAK